MTWQTISFLFDGQIRYTFKMTRHCQRTVFPNHIYGVTSNTLRDSLISCNLSGDLSQRVLDWYKCAAKFKFKSRVYVKLWASRWGLPLWKELFWKHDVSSAWFASRVTAARTQTVLYKIARLLERCLWPLWRHFFCIEVLSSVSVNNIFSTFVNSLFCFYFKDHFSHWSGKCTEKLSFSDRVFLHLRTNCVWWSYTNW